MTDSPAHWIVIPCYNEADRLPVDAVRAWLPSHPDFGLLLVNDGSTDGTGQLIHDLAAAIGSQCDAFDLSSNQGKAEAVRQGLLRVLDRSPRTIGYLDADLATPLDELPRLLHAMESTQSDMAIGSRVRLLGRDIRRRAIRHYLGRFFAAAASITLGLAVYDTQCGAKLIAVRPWTRGLLEGRFVSRWVFDVELIARYLADVRMAPRWPREPCGIIEVPLLKWHDIGGSKVRGRDFVRAVVELVAIARKYAGRRTK